mmetsp:Transcript_100318/g.312618  ORF Transcript_100318/g.312618 Transcript_100318/m.312618 type:complete len:85 (-) Transcript_100318:1743-1997(-)
MLAECGGGFTNALERFAEASMCCSRPRVEEAAHERPRRTARPYEDQLIFAQPPFVSASGGALRKYFFSNSGCSLYGSKKRPYNS